MSDATLPALPVTVATDGEFNVELTTDQGRYKMVDARMKKDLRAQSTYRRHG